MGNGESSGEYMYLSVYSNALAVAVIRKDHCIVHVVADLAGGEHIPQTD